MSDSNSEFEFSIDDNDPWNVFVDYAWRAPLPAPGSPQRDPVLVARYDGEVGNGGHFQYFANGYLPLASETATALRELGGPEHADLLEEAISLAPPQKRIGSVEQYIEEAADSALIQLDIRYSELSPSVHKLLERFVDSHVGLSPRDFKPEHEPNPVSGKPGIARHIVVGALLFVGIVAYCARS